MPDAMTVMMHRAAVVVATAAVLVTASPLLFGSRPVQETEQGSSAIGHDASGLNITGGLPGAPNAPSQAHVQHVDGLLSELDILFVLDPNFFLCWESIRMDESTKDTLLPWVSSLKDAFTRSSESPAGLDLEVRQTGLRG